MAWWREARFGLFIHGAYTLNLIRYHGVFAPNSKLRRAFERDRKNNRNYV